MIFAEVGDGLVIRRKTLGEPHQLDIATRLALQPAAGRDRVEIAVDVKLQKNGGMIAGSAGGARIDGGEAECAQIQHVDEGVDRADGVVLTDEIVEMRRKKSALLPSHAL